MQKIGLIAATVVALSFCSVEAWAQQSKPMSGAAYEKAICDCRKLNMGNNRWPDCMMRHGYWELGPGGKRNPIPATAGDWANCKKKS